MHPADAFRVFGAQGGLEGDEEGAGDDGAMAMYGCLRALSSVLDCVSGVESMFPQLEELLFPIMQRFCSSEGDEVLEEILELISYFTYFSPQVPPPSARLLPSPHLAQKKRRSPLVRCVVCSFRACVGAAARMSLHVLV